MVKPKLYVFTLQPLKERYTELWYVWFRRELSKYFDVIYIDGDVLESRIVTGAFLPVLGSHYWELKQLERWIRLLVEAKVDDNSSVLLMDLEYPGLGYKVKDLANQLGMNLNVFAWLHAGSYTYGDFTQQLQDYQKFLELAWMRAVDLVFVASKYHKRAIIKRRLRLMHNPLIKDDLNIIKDKIVVVGNPFYIKDVWRIAGINKPKPFNEREYDLIITDRPDLEKNIITTLALAKLTNAKRIAVVTGRLRYEGWNFKDVRRLVQYYSYDLYEDVSKREYYRLLNDSKVWLTASQEENFGYCAVEALAFNTIPVMPKCCAFIEHVEGNNLYLYSGYDEAIFKVNKYLRRMPEKELFKYVVKYEDVLNRIAKIILGELNV